MLLDNITKVIDRWLANYYKKHMPPFGSSVVSYNDHDIESVVNYFDLDVSSDLISFCLFRQLYKQYLTECSLNCLSVQEKERSLSQIIRFCQLGIYQDSLSSSFFRRLINISLDQWEDELKAEIDNAAKEKGRCKVEWSL